MAGVLGLALFAGLVGRIDTTLAAAGSVATVLSGLVAYVFVMGSQQRRRSCRLIAAARSGRPLRDGEPAAVHGRIHPVGAVLRSPFADRECVAYEYQMRAMDTVQSWDLEDSSPTVDKEVLGHRSSCSWKPEVSSLFRRPRWRGWTFPWPSGERR